MCAATGISRMYFDALSKKYHFSLREPVEKLSPEVMDVILYGTKGEKLELHYDQPRGKGVLYQPFEGIVNNLERRYQETQSESVRAELEECMSECPCPACQGRRLRRESLAVTVGRHGHRRVHAHERDGGDRVWSIPSRSPSSSCVSASAF